MVTCCPRASSWNWTHCQKCPCNTAIKISTRESKYWKSSAINQSNIQKTGRNLCVCNLGSYRIFCTSIEACIYTRQIIKSKSAKIHTLSLFHLKTSLRSNGRVVALVLQDLDSPLPVFVSISNFIQLVCCKTSNLRISGTLWVPPRLGCRSQLKAWK